jgi:transposase-like protein
MQILHPLTGSVQQYVEQLADADRYRPSHCPLCQAKRPLTAHGFYSRTIVDSDFDGTIRVRRYLCQTCRRTVSLLPEFALPYLRSSITVIALFLVARLLQAKSLIAALPATSPYQRGQFWLRRFRSRAESLCASLAARATPITAPTFVQRALAMLETAGWISAHRFLFVELREHLLGWPPSLAPDGRRVALRPVPASA